jgi:hypothetical protein
MRHGLYNHAFLPLEPKNQRDARKRPDAAIWRVAENKELDMLFGRSTFEMTDRPDGYDPLPLQFVYKLKVTNGDYENGVLKARLVAMGNLQYDDRRVRGYVRSDGTTMDGTSASCDSCAGRTHNEEV